MPHATDLSTCMSLEGAGSRAPVLTAPATIQQPTRRGAGQLEQLHRRAHGARTRQVVRTAGCCHPLCSRLARASDWRSGCPSPARPRCLEPRRAAREAGDVVGAVMAHAAVAKRKGCEAIVKRTTSSVDPWSRSASVLGDAGNSSMCHQLRSAWAVVKRMHRVVLLTPDPAYNGRWGMTFGSRVYANDADLVKHT